MKHLIEKKHILQVDFGGYSFLTKIKFTAGSHSKTFIIEKSNYC